MLAVSTGSLQQIFRGEKRVHGSGTEALQIEGYKLESQCFENASELRGHGGIKSPRQLLACDFNANDFSMMADTELAETQIAEGVFAPFYNRESFARNRAAVLDAGGKAGGCGLVPDAQASGAGESADFVFGERGIEERRNHVMIGRSFLAGTEVALVVQIHAVRDGVEAASVAQIF